MCSQTSVESNHGRERIGAQDMIMIDNNKFDQAMDKVLSNITCFMGEKVLSLWISSFLQEALPYFNKEVGLKSQMICSIGFICPFWYASTSSPKTKR
jgi:hypothetical protein